jgi:DNA-binding GntR family transcriptional regulator
MEYSACRILSAGGDLAEPLSRTFLVDQAYQAILERLLSGALAPGTPVSEVDLARTLGVSRTPVHLAVARLARDGLLEHPPGRKPRVARFAKEDLVEVYEMRLLHETAAVERASENLAPDDLAGLLQAAEDLVAADSSPASWSRKALDLDERLHHTLASASGNRRLRDELARFRLLSRAFGRSSPSPDSVRDQAAVLKALRGRNPALACQAMAKHLQNRLDAVLEKLFPEAR